MCSITSWNFNVARHFTAPLNTRSSQVYVMGDDLDVPHPRHYSLCVFACSCRVNGWPTERLDVPFLEQSTTEARGLLCVGVLVCDHVRCAMERQMLFPDVRVYRRSQDTVLSLFVCVDVYQDDGDVESSFMMEVGRPRPRHVYVCDSVRAWWCISRGIMETRMLVLISRKGCWTLFGCLFEWVKWRRWRFRNDARHGCRF